MTPTWSSFARADEAIVMARISVGNGRNPVNLNSQDLSACVLSKNERFCERQGTGKTIRTPICFFDHYLSPS